MRLMHHYNGWQSCPSSPRLLDGYTYKNAIYYDIPLELLRFLRNVHAHVKVPPNISAYENEVMILYPGFFTEAYQAYPHLAPGFGSYVEALVWKLDVEFNLCGVRGGGNAAAQALFWQAKKGLSFVLAFESERERNAAIMLARRLAYDCNIMLAGPDGRASLGS